MQSIREGIDGASEQWFYFNRDDEQCGPVTTATLALLWDAREVHEATYVWEPMTCVDWVPIAQSWLGLHFSQRTTRGPESE